MATVETEPTKPAEPLLLSCGHGLGEVVTSAEGTSYCAACEREAVIEGEAVEVSADSPLDEDQASTHEADEQRQDTATEGADSAPPQPAFGTRGTEPGRRGCWALNSRGEPCGSFKRRDGDYCTAHSGLGIGTDPKRWSGEAHAARREQLAARASLRLVMGDRGRIGPRAILREHVNRQAIALAGRAVGAALSPATDDAKAASIAIRLIETADPAQSASLELSGDLSAEAIEGLGMSELLAVAQQYGVELPETPALPA